MEYRQLIIDKDDKVVIDYLNRLFDADSRVLIEKGISGNYLVWRIGLPPEYVNMFCRFVARSIVLSRKYDYICGKIKIGELSYAKICFLMSLLYFDIQSEVNRIVEVIRDLEEISIEGVSNFCMTGLRTDWQELLELVEVLIGNKYDDYDIFSVVSFVMSTKVKGNKSLFLAEYPDVLLTNVTDGVIVLNVRLFDNPEYDIISSVIAESPKELIVEKGKLPDELCKVLEKLTDVKML